MSVRSESETAEPQDINAPRPILRSGPRQIAPKGVQEQNGITESDRLLAAIVTLARKEPQTNAIKSALRSLIVKFSREIALDF